MDDDAVPLPPGFEVSVASSPRRALVRIVGDLDMATVDRLSAATRDLLTGGRHVVFDLAGVSFVDSSGLRYFLDLHQRAGSVGFSFALRRGRRSVHKTFEVAGLDRVLPWEDAEEGPR